MKIYNNSDSLSVEAQSLIIGSLFGDGGIVCNAGVNGNARVSFTQGIDQLPYLQWKYEILKSYTITGITGPQYTNYGGVIYRFNTVSHPIFTEYYRMIYHNNKKTLSKEYLGRMTPLALAVWWMDDGSYQRNYGTLSTYALKHEESEMVAEFLRGWDIDCHACREPKGTVIRFSKRGIAGLVSTVEQHVIPFMRYKVGDGEHPKRPDIIPIIKKDPIKCVICGREFLAKKCQKACSKECQKVNARRLCLVAYYKKKT